MERATGRFKPIRRRMAEFVVNIQALRVMMDLLQLRAEREKHRIRAVVIASSDPATPGSEQSNHDDVESHELDDDATTMHLRLDLSEGVPAGAIEEDAMIELHRPVWRKPRRARIVSIKTEHRRTLVDTDLPCDAFEIGDEVEVQTISRFGMWAHQRAVHDLLGERVEGSWCDLAELLCSPENLVAPDVRAEGGSFFCDYSPGAARLNDRQRDAVRKAVATPHTFCIQGPPGTGKTMVICELVQQLIAKGERVLLLAPTHVAVDEVLRRIGSRDRVRALRISWDDSRVAEDVRKFTPTNIIDPFIEAQNNLTIRKPVVGTENSRHSLLPLVRYKHFKSPGTSGTLGISNSGRRRKHPRPREFA